MVHASSRSVPSSARREDCSHSGSSRAKSGGRAALPLRVRVGELRMLASAR
jgi:hypothetical protein